MSEDFSSCDISVERLAIFKKFATNLKSAMAISNKKILPDGNRLFESYTGESFLFLIFFPFLVDPLDKVNGYVDVIALPKSLQRGVIVRPIVALLLHLIRSIPLPVIQKGILVRAGDFPLSLLGKRST